MINDRGPRDLALRALRDCGVIRAPLSHPGIRMLWADFCAEPTIGGHLAEGRWTGG
jgi:hypothetical protein